MAQRNSTLDDYIKKFGEEDGKRRFSICLKRREKREAGLKSGRTGYKKKIEYGESHIQSGDAIKCHECGALLPRIQWTHLKKCSNLSIGQYKEKHSDAALVAPNLRMKCAITKENMLELYGEDGEEKFKDYQAKQAISNTFEYKLEKHGWTKEQFDAYNVLRSSTLENFVKRHGEDNGLELWDAYCERQRYTTTLEYFKEAFGELGEYKFHQFNLKRNFENRKSSISEKELYDSLVSQLTDLQPQIGFEEDFYYHPFDMGSKDKKKLIEFYGSYWHCDPRQYAGDFFHKQKNQTAEQIRSRDQAKRTYAMNKGVQVYVVWEHDWKTNKDKVIDDIVKWWNDDSAN